MYFSLLVWLAWSNTWGSGWGRWGRGLSSNAAWLVNQQRTGFKRVIQQWRVWPEENGVHGDVGLLVLWTQAGSFPTGRVSLQQLIGYSAARTLLAPDSYLHLLFLKHSSLAGGWNMPISTLLLHPLLFKIQLEDSLKLLVLVPQWWCIKLFKNWGCSPCKKILFNTVPIL